MMKKNQKHSNLLSDLINKMSKSHPDSELHEIMREQMGMDPETCDPAFYADLKRKFYGTSQPAASNDDGWNTVEADQPEKSAAKVEKKKKKLSAAEKKKRSKQSNIIDKMQNEDDDDMATFMKANEEKNIHLQNDNIKDRNQSDQLNFGDLFGQMENPLTDHSKANEAVDSAAKGDNVNTTKLKQQLKVLKKDASKEVQVKLSGYKRLKI